MKHFDWQPIELSAPRLLRSLDDPVRYRRGAFIELAESITLADIITLDRATTCVRKSKRLAELSAARGPACRVAATRRS